MTRARAAALVPLVGALALTGAFLAPPATAKAAPVLTLTSAVTPNYPQQVPTAASGETTRVVFTVTSTETAGSVTATASGPGLVIINPHQSLGTVAGPITLSFEVAGAEPGFHALIVDVSGPGATSAEILVPYIWTTGSPLFTGTNPIYQRSFGWQGTEHVAGLESSTRAARMLTIVDSHFAYVGLPPNGRPVCTQEGNGCLPYAFDARTGLLQVGSGIIAALHRNSLYTDGLVPADQQDGELFGRYDFPAQSGFSSPSSVLSGMFKYSSPDYPTGLTYERATFRKDGTYALAYAVDGGKVRKLEGTFRLGRHGEITFRSRRGKLVQRGTVLGVGRTLPCARNGTCRTTSPRPGQLGIWLILSGRKGRHPDGNLLQLVR